MLKKIKSLRHEQGVKPEHWLDYSEDTFGQNLIRDVRAVFKILILYLPLPIYFALFDQQVSRIIYLNFIKLFATYHVLRLMLF